MCIEIYIERERERDIHTHISTQSQPLPCSKEWEIKNKIKNTTENADSGNEVIKEILSCLLYTATVTAWSL